MEIYDVLKDLGASLLGDYYIMYCPKCGKREAYCYVDDIKKWIENPKHRIPIRCNRLNKCGEISYLNDYLKGIKKPTNIKMKEVKTIQMSSEGIKLLQTYCHYIIESVKCNTNGFDFTYRGISNQTFKNNGIIYNKDTFQQLINQESTKHFFGKKYRSANYLNRDIIIPIMNLDGYPERLLLRSTYYHSEKYKKEVQVMLVKNGLEIWNIKDIFDKEKKKIFVTEGVYDALSIKEVCQNPNVGIVSLPGVKKYKKLIRLLKSHQEFKDKTFIIAFDSDEAGQDFLKNAVEDFSKADIKCKVMNLRPYKDANDFLIQNKSALKFRVYKTLLKT